MKKPLRIGIYAGTFDPVHVGHISFALQAMKIAKLDKLYFLPERRPRAKQGVEHFGHRVAMLKRACRPHAAFGVLELDELSFSVDRSLPQLKKRFRNNQLIFLVGSDVAEQLPSWSHAEKLLANSELVVGVRGGHDHKKLSQQIATWPMQPKASYLVESYAAEVSSGAVREALRERRYVRGLLSSVASYSNRHWLYVSLA